MGEEQRIKADKVEPGTAKALAPRGLIITHGALGEELKRTAELILGRSDGLDALSNSGLSTAALAERIQEVLAAEPKERPIVVFVDLLGGSCGLASSELFKTHPAARIITGVNLAMIIAFLQYRETMEPRELAAGIVMRAHRGIAVIPALAAEDETGVGQA